MYYNDDFYKPYQESKAGQLRPHSSLGNVPPEQFAAQNLPLKTDPIRASGTIKNDLQNFKLT